AFMRRLGNRAEIIWGDIADTVMPFLETVNSSAPLGFISIDVDIYTATKASLQCLTGQPDQYNPAISMYFDDVVSFFSNDWAGELAAISEFNSENDRRKIDVDRSLPGRRPRRTEDWYRQMYVGHVLDHEFRQTPRKRQQLTIGAHSDFVNSQRLA